LESGQVPLNRTQIRLEDLVAEVMEMQLPLAAAKELQLENQVRTDLPPVWADAELISRLLQNLVSNAIKFTPEGGKVCVGATAQEHEGRQMLFVTVSDNGPGIPPEIQGRLFQKFVTGRQVGRGSGLGLAFCKLAIEAHGERIWVDSVPERGTTFIFTLSTWRGGTK
jgi:signal transduction histidine kinase